LCLERIVPALRSQDMPVNLGSLKGSLSEQARKINQAMAGGKITPSDASSVLSALTSQAKIQEFDELEQRIAKLEARQ